MNFITIDTKWNESVAINPLRVTSIKLTDGVVYIFMGDRAPIATKFTDIAHAVDYLQKATFVSLDDFGRFQQN